MNPGSWPLTSPGGCAGGGSGRAGRGEMHGVAARRGGLPARVVIVARVEAEMARAGRGRQRHRDRDRVRQGGQLLHVGAVGPGEDGPEGYTAPIGQQVALRAALGAVGGVGPARLRLAILPFLPSKAFTMHPSAACHSHCKPIASSYSASRCAHARSRQPYSTHSCSRSRAVDLGQIPRAARLSTGCRCATARSAGRGARGRRCGCAPVPCATCRQPGAAGVPPQRVVQAADRWVVAGRWGGRRSGRLCFHRARLPRRSTFRIGCKYAG